MDRVIQASYLNIRDSLVHRLHLIMNTLPDGLRIVVVTPHPTENERIRDLTDDDVMRILTDPRIGNITGASKDLLDAIDLESARMYHEVLDIVNEILTDPDGSDTTIDVQVNGGPLGNTSGWWPMVIRFTDFIISNLDDINNM